MKQKTRRFSKSLISILLSVCMVFSCLTIGIFTVNAYDYKSGRIYFDDTNTNWGSAYLVINYDNDSAWYEWKAMTAISGTKLFYLDVSGNASNVHRYFFTKSSQTNGNNKTINSNYAGSFGWNFNGGNAYFKPSSNNSSNVNGTYNDNSINNISDYKVNLYAKVALTNNGSSYLEQTSGSNGGKVKLESMYWSNATSTGSSGTDESYTGTSYENAVKTGTANWLYTSLADDYEFVKWAETVGGTSVSNNSNWRVTGDRTLYAHFRKLYSVSTSVSGTGGTLSTSGYVKGTYMRNGSTLTITANPSTGYELDKVIIKNNSTNAQTTVNASSFSNNSYSYSMPTADITVTGYFKRSNILYTGVKAAVSTSPSRSGVATANPSTGQDVYSNTGTAVSYILNDNHYQFVNWTTSSGMGSFSSSSAVTSSNSASPTFYPYQNNATATANFTEKTFAVTLNNNGTSSTINPGYYTAVATGAHRAKTGYDPVGWKVTSGSVIVGSTTYTVNQVIPGDSINVNVEAAAALQATYQIKNNNIIAHFPTGNSYDSDNTISVVSSANYNTDYTINVTLASGYDVGGITINGTAVSISNPSGSSGNTKSYTYTMGTSDVEAVITLKADKPTFTYVKIRDNSTSSFPLKTFANGEHVYHFLAQPDIIKAKTDFGTVTYKTSKNGSTISQKTGQTSDVEVTMSSTYSPSTEPTSEDWTDTYKLTVTAYNKPNGIATAETTDYEYTIHVSLNDTQKYYVKIKNLLNVYIAEDVSDNPYYREGAPIQAYNTKRTAAVNFTNGGMPAYNALSGTTAYNNAKTAYDEFVEAINNLMLYAKKSTVYVLTKHANSSSAPVKLHIWRGTKSEDDKAHFDMYDYGADKLADDTYKMTYYGKFTKNGDRYMYKFEYTGHIDFLVFKDANNDNEVDYEDPLGYEKLTLDITGCTDFKEYYINAYNADPSNNPTFDPVTDYVDFDIIKAEGKKSIEIGQTKTKAQIKTLLGLQAVSSLVSAPGITVTDTEFKISAPDGRIFNMQNNTYYDPVSGTNKTLTGGLFPADKQGKYTVSYKVRFGYKSDGTTPIVGEITATFWVAYDDINVYIDMNDNIGTPVLYFKYYLNSSGTPVAEGTSGATVEYLPYEMDLVTGSESIYKYTISKKKLEEYALTIDSTHPFKIAYIMVEGKYVDAAGKHDRLADVTPANAFSIPLDARITGEIWYKADNTNFNTFKTISYGSVINTFAAVNESNVVLTDAIKSIRGTGIITDNELIYQNQYAGYDSTVNLPKFHYVLKTVAAQEVKVSGTTYYFDKWVKVKSGVVSSGASGTTLSYSGEALEVIESSDINLTSNPDYNEGDGDYTYFAKYKAVGAASSTVPVRMEITYKFPDYKTSDGNYEYDEKKATVEAHYTKTVKVPLGSTYSTFNAVKNAAKTIAENNMPFIQSNYFDYHYEDIFDEEDNLTSFKVDSFDSDTGKINATMALSKTAHKYYIVVGAKTYEGYYQQTKTLNKTECGGSAYSNPVWKDSAGNILAVGDTFDAKFFSSGNESSGDQDCQIITLVNQSDASVNHTTVVSKSYNEVFYKDSTEMVRHNFFIIDYCAEGELLGGGVLFATTDGSGNYRQQNAGTNLSDNTHRTAFIESILGSGANMDVNTEYKAQTIDNTGFRYKPFRSSDDVFRYSKDYNAYLTLFEAENINSGYGDQKIRVFSFMVYNNNGTPTIVISNSFAEVTRMYNYS